MARYEGVYASLKFPAYEFRGYPKAIYGDNRRDGMLGIAENEEHEQKILEAKGQTLPPRPKMPGPSQDMSAIMARLEAIEAENAEMKKQLMASKQDAVPPTPPAPLKPATPTPPVKLQAAVGGNALKAPAVPAKAS